MIKVYQDRDWLYEHYIIQGQSSVAMAKEAGCHSTTIRTGLHKFDIPIHCYSGTWHDRDRLREQYIVREKSSYAIAQEVGCSQATIMRWLRRLEIPTRSCGDGIFLALRNSVIITPDLLKFLGGEILGDGHLRMMGNRSALYSHSSKYEEYLLWLSGQFAKWGIEQAGQINNWKDKGTGKIYYHYNSRSYPELVPIRQRWYRERDGKMKKTVPESFKLTPMGARQWYLGDGGLQHLERKHRSILLGTYDFTPESVEYLVKELNGLGFKATRRPASNTIGIWTHSAQDFLSWIGPCPISCYDYRWDYVK